MTFREWLKIVEVGTSTADIAAFPRPFLPLVRREYPRPPKRKKKRLNQDR
jgi:hypothetical protein